MGNEKVIAKIRALRALATSSNVHEAAAAAAQAAKLLLMHDLIEADVDAIAGEPVEAPTIADEPLDRYGSRIPGWKSSLAGFLTRTHGCAGWLRRMKPGAPSSGDGSTDWTYVLVGRRSDVETVRYLYAWLTSEITRIANATGRGNGRAWFNAFHLGAVVGIMEQMKVATAEVRAQATGTSLAIVDSRQAAAEALKPGGLKTTRSPRFSSGDGFRRGQEAGRSMHVGKAIGSSGGAARALGSGR